MDRLAIWVAGVPHPTEGASTVLFWEYVSGLRARGSDVMTVVLAESGNATRDGIAEFEVRAGELGIRVAVASAPSFVVERRHVVTLREDALAAATDAAESFRADVTFCLDLVPAWAARHSSSPRVVWLGDLRFETVKHHALYAARERVGESARLPLALLRARAWRRAYREALAGAAAVIVSSKSSERALARMGIAAEYQPYPWPAHVGDVERSTTAAVPSFLFLGTLGALGSRSALHFLFGRLYPRLVRLWGPGGFRVLIAGRGTLPQWARKALETRPEIEHVGFVDDLGAVLATVHAAIAPISVPVGNRSRILTALAAGTPVVAHANAALGNPDLRDSETCFLARDAGAFAERMRLCVDEPELATAVAQRGRELYRTRFAPGVAVAAAADTLASVSSTASRAVTEPGR